MLAGAGSRHITIQKGGIKMRNRAVWVLIGAVLVGDLALAGIGVGSWGLLESSSVCAIPHLRWDKQRTACFY